MVGKLSFASINTYIVNTSFSRSIVCIVVYEVQTKTMHVE